MFPFYCSSDFSLNCFWMQLSIDWLGRAARGVPTYKGPHLNLSAFHKLNCTKCRKPITDNNYLATMDAQVHLFFIAFHSHWWHTNSITENVQGAANANVNWIQSSRSIKQAMISIVTTACCLPPMCPHLLLLVHTHTARATIAIK